MTGATLHQLFSKRQLQVVYDAIKTITDCYMLDKDSIINASVSEAVKKIPTNEKDYRKCTFMCFTLYNHRIQRTTLYSHRPTYS